MLPDWYHWLPPATLPTSNQYALTFVPAFHINVVALVVRVDPGVGDGGDVKAAGTTDDALNAVYVYSLYTLVPLLKIV
jgi:hypothetical protein